MNNNLLTEFPKEGYYYSVTTDVDSLTNYLNNNGYTPYRTINKPINTIGIGWSDTKKWWYKYTTSQNKDSLVYATEQLLPFINKSPIDNQLDIKPGDYMIVTNDTICIPKHTLVTLISSYNFGYIVKYRKLNRYICTKDIRKPTVKELKHILDRYQNNTINLAQIEPVNSEQHASIEELPVLNLHKPINNPITVKRITLNIKQINL